MPPFVFVSATTNPFSNLAIENALLAEITEPTLFLYQNMPCVVIGRAQNPWLEADVDFLHQNNIPLLRRQSGGGTVVHDLGNLNFCFLSPKLKFDKMQNMLFVQQALFSLGIAVEIGEKYDLLFESKKVSGSAFRETSRNCFHHGTLLLNSDLNFLRRCLQAPPRNIISKSVRSRSSPVTNLNLDIDLVKQALCSVIAAKTDIQTLHWPSLDPHLCLDYKQLEATIALYQSDDWIYGKTMPFSEEVWIEGKRVTLMHNPSVSAKMTLISSN